MQALANIVKLASANRFDLGIRSGHWLWWGAATTGICISTSKLKKFEVDATGQTVTVGAGITKGEADEYLKAYDQAVISTTFSATTLIGAAVEGGIGWLSGEHGLACDNLLGARVVVADGGIIYCSPSENKDLFWAIKGAGCNFGIVVEATFRTVATRPTVYFAALTYPKSSLSFVIETVAQLHKILPTASRISMRVEITKSKTELKLHIFHNGDKSEAKLLFAPLILEAETVDAGMVPYADLESQYASAPDHVSGNRWASSGVNPAGPWIDVEGLAAMCNDFIDSTGCVSESTLRYGVLGIDIQNMDQINKPSGDDAAFAARHAAAFCYSRFVWDDASCDGAYERLAKTFGNKWSAAIGPKDGRAAVAYPAFCTPGKLCHNIMILLLPAKIDVLSDQLTAENIFGANYPRLQKVKAKYDPENVFNKKRTIVPDFS